MGQRYSVVNEDVFTNYSSVNVLQGSALTDAPGEALGRQRRNMQNSCPPGTDGQGRRTKSSGTMGRGRPKRYGLAPWQNEQS